MAFAAIGCILPASAKQLPRHASETATQAITQILPPNMGIGQIKVKSIDANNSRKQLTVVLSGNFADVPFNAEYLNLVKETISSNIPSRYNGYKINLKIGDRNASDYLPEYDKEYRRSHAPFVSNDNPDKHYSKGLDGNIIALWQSHGWYFEPKLNRWEWQRARIFQTVEDLYTQSFVMPYLMPMLENAGAYVMSPRERDTSIHEMIVDADGGKAQNSYKETDGKEKWQKGKESGFAYMKDTYTDFDNPFAEGSFRQVKATSDKKNLSRASWSVEVPEDGTYAIYISYKTLPASVTDAGYTINSLSGSESFTVNQQMGGGTWIYLGHFPLRKGQNNDVVQLSNYSKSGKGVVTADAVKIGGGMGNIARKVEFERDEEGNPIPPKDGKMLDIDYRYTLSNHPRYTEGARYFLQWAGVPDSVYSPTEGINDYNDDYQSRGLWVNYLAGGSDALPDKEGLNIPVDIAFAFHSDAGTTMNDSIIGSLGIYFTNDFDSYANGTPRIMSRALTDSVLTNIVNDVRSRFEPEWTRRGMWDRSYFEARVPEVPTMLLELLSHQNFADMKYGLDPNFRFTVSRAIYKGMLQFIAARDGREYVVQPLPVNSFAIDMTGDNEFTLSWKPTKDTLCDNADATKYVILERIGDSGFKEIAVVGKTHYSVKISDNKIHSYKIVAMNDGGRSFPSEVLACGTAPDSKGKILVINGFTRISAPDYFDAGTIAGFYSERDHGVPYMQEICYIGQQFEFRRNIPWMDDDAAGFGASRSDYETTVIAGNTFDYPAIHGEAIIAAGYSFTSASAKAVEDGTIDMNRYQSTDLILGKQKEYTVGRGAHPSRYAIFNADMRKRISDYCSRGGNMLVSGAFIATDIWDKQLPDSDKIEFAENVLGYKWRTGQASLSGEVYSVPSEYKQTDMPNAEWQFYNTLNGDMYCVESPDAIIPAQENAATILRYKENNLPAGVAADMGKYKTYVIGFPFETVKDAGSRAVMMKSILNFFETNTKIKQ